MEARFRVLFWKKLDFRRNVCDFDVEIVYFSKIFDDNLIFLKMLQAYEDTVREVAYYMDLLAIHDERFQQFDKNWKNKIYFCTPKTRFERTISSISS